MWIVRDGSTPSSVRLGVSVSHTSITFPLLFIPSLKRVREAGGIIDNPLAFSTSERLQVKVLFWDFPRDLFPLSSQYNDKVQPCISMSITLADYSWLKIQNVQISLRTGKESLNVRCSNPIHHFNPKMSKKFKVSVSSV